MESDSWEDRLCEWKQMLVNKETAILEDEEVEQLEKPIWSVIPKTEVYEYRR
ncbi:2570_t:CDS:2, partial [Gigaspora rosea]